MSRLDTLVIAFSPEEWADFLPEPVASEVKSLARDCRLVDTTGLSAEAWARSLASADPDALLACWSTPPLPEALPSRLRYVCYTAGSVRHLVSRARIEGGLAVTNWGGSISRTVAECALLLILAALRRAGRLIPAMHRSGAWRSGPLEGASLFGRRVGLHGFGASARELIRLLQPFGVKIGVCAPETDPALYTAHGVGRVADLETLFAGHDVVVEMAPLNSATRGAVTDRLLRLIPAGGVFVNVARGAIVDEEALVRVAREGRIQVGLDVYATEPLPVDSGLRGLPNAVLLPHVAGPTPDRRRDAGAFALRNLRAFAEGRPLQAVITPELYDSLT